LRIRERLPRGPTSLGSALQLIDNAQVGERGVATEVEEVLSQAPEAGAVTLAVVDGGEAVLDGDATPKLDSTFG